MNHHNGECNQAQPMIKADAPETAKSYVSLPNYTLRTALRQAEQAVNAININLRNTEIERDELARQLGAKQDFIDRLTNEREYLTKHVRELQMTVNH